MLLNELPAEILDKIFSYLTLKEKFQYERVCRQWQRLIFRSVKTLEFEKWVIGGFRCTLHKQVISQENQLPEKIMAQDNVKQTIIRKCGTSLRSFKGPLSLTAVKALADHCPFLSCLDFSFDDLQTLQMIIETCGHQVTCMIIRVCIPEYVVMYLLLACTNLNFLTVRVLVKTTFDENLLKDSEGDPEPAPLPCVTKLRSFIVFGAISQVLLKQFKMLTCLEKVGINFSRQMSEWDEWKTPIQLWSDLRVLVLRIVDDVENKPGVGGIRCELPHNLVCLTVCYLCVNDPVIPLQVTNYLPNLKTLNICNVTFTPPATFRKTLESLTRSCPNIIRLYIAFDEATPLQDEHFSPLYSLRLLKDLTFGKRTVISDTLPTKLMTQLESLTRFTISRRNVSIRHRKVAGPDGQLVWQH